MSRVGFQWVRAATLWLLAAVGACATAQPVTTEHVSAELVADGSQRSERN